jgi:hypothetical protein
MFLAHFVEISATTAARAKLTEQGRNDGHRLMVLIRESEPNLAPTL